MHNFQTSALTSLIQPQDRNLPVTFSMITSIIIRYNFLNYTCERLPQYLMRERSFAPDTPISHTFNMLPQDYTMSKCTVCEDPCGCSQGQQKDREREILDLDRLSED